MKCLPWPDKSKTIIMNKTVFTIIAFAALAFVPVKGQTYASLWNQEKAAERKDLPKTQIEVLRKIQAKAAGEKDYGQLLKAEMKSVSLLCGLSVDSLGPATDRLKAKEKNTSDAVLRAVYSAILYKIFSGEILDGCSSDSLAAHYKARAVADVKTLAATRVSLYEPFVIKGYNASVFGDDMLSVIGYETRNHEAMHRYYSAAGMRQAACITALEMLRGSGMERGGKMNKSGYIKSLDSLINEYSDLDIVCEAAIERYDAMNICTDVTVEDRISYINYAIGKWGGWQHANVLRNRKKSLTDSRFEVYSEYNTVAPGVGSVIKLRELRNISSLTMNVYRVNATGETKLSPDTEDGYRAMRPLLKALPDRRVTRKFMAHPDYFEFADSITLAGLPAGVYMLEFQSVPATMTVRKVFYVTSVFTMAEALPENTVRCVVVDVTTGQPLPGAKIKLSGRGNGLKTNNVVLTCDDKGEALHKFAANRWWFDKVYAYTQADKYSPVGRMYTIYGYSEGNSGFEQTNIFTDRSIYRPGQTVHVSAVTYMNTNRVDNIAVAGRSVTAVLRDANRKVLAERQLTTDKYGSCSTDFTLPAGMMNGNYTVQVGKSARGIRVEEYKRPTFNIEFPAIDEKYGAGDTLVLKAKALSYAGVAVQGAKVRYTVRRDVALWWRGIARGVRSFPLSGETVWTGDAVTGEDGTFAVEVPLTLPAKTGMAPMHYNFVVEADVTDTAGETQNASMSVRLGTKEATLTGDLPEKVLGDSLKTITFTLYNAAGMTMVSDVRFYIDNENDWQQARTGSPVELRKRLAAGRHCLFAVCDGDTLRQDFTVFGLDDTVPCVDTCAWFYTSAGSFPRDGGAVTVQVGSSDKDVHIVYSILSGNKIIESGSTDVSNGLINRKLTYKDEYGDGLRIMYAWVKDGRYHDYAATIERPLPDKRLKMSWTTFRDRLTPGQKEEWRLRIIKPDGTPADARLTATLYDKALDNIMSHNWRFDVFSSLNIPYSSWTSMRRMPLSGFAMASSRSLQSKEFDAGRFDIGMVYSGFLMPAASTRKYRVMGTGIMAKTEMSADMGEMEAGRLSAAGMADELKEVKEENSVTGPYGMDGNGAGGDVYGEVQMRENFNETAFFCPDAVTDKDGIVTLSFTLPESLTTWRFMGVAHTQDMLNGMIQGEAVATKEIMIQPNVPRFVRMGDKSQITARIFNTGTETVKGTARMELIDPETDKTVYKEAKQVTIDAGGTSGVTFGYSPSVGHTLLICRISVSGKDFSDGEQHYLPVLPDRERVTVTVPFTQNGPGVKTIDISKLIPVKDGQTKLTVEYTDNPAWMMVQALPVIASPNAENAIDRMAAVYANTVAASIMGGSPKIKAAIARWNMESGSETSMMSAMRKNGELRDIVLAETPWVADADNEDEQKRQIADLLDGARIESRTVSTVRKLIDTQNADGSWGWCPGMRGNPYVTVTAVQMYARMKAMIGNEAGCGAMMDKAFKYMDGEIVRLVSDMKKAESNGVEQSFPGMMPLQYLYSMAISDRKPSNAARSACDYLIALLKKDIASQSIYAKALTAIILARHGEKAKSREYVRSLKEYTVYNEETGRYYDTRRASYSWCDYKIPTQVAAIEAIKAVTPADDKTIGEMRRWLLQQKRTQAWDTPINSVNAVYAFLFDNTNALSAGTETVLAIDGKRLETPGATAGLGYVKTAVTNPRGTELTATKTSEGTSWGAVYVQYMRKTPEVSATGSGIKVKREIIPSGTDGKKTVKELSVGDRVTVRITLEASRDFDFVQITDRRAACMEPVNRLSGYRNGAYISPKDNSTNYYIDMLPKGTWVIEDVYYIDRAGTYETGTCAAACVYAPEYRATEKSQTVNVK